MTCHRLAVASANETDLLQLAESAQREVSDRLADARRQLEESGSDFRAASAATRPASEGRVSLVLEALGYAGVVVALTGVVMAYSSQYRVLGAAGRIAVWAVVGAAALTAALLLGPPARKLPLNRARAAALTLLVVAAGLLAAQVQVELVPPSVAQAARIALIGGLCASVVAAGSLVWTGNGLLAVALSASLFATAGALNGLRFLPDTGWGSQIAWAVAGAILVATGELSRRMGRRWAAEILALLGVGLPVLIAYSSASGGGELAIQLVAGSVAIAAFGASAARASIGYAIAGGVGLLGFVLDIELRYLQNRLGLALTLIVAGLVLPTIAFLLPRLLPHLHRRTIAEQ